MIFANHQSRLWSATKFKLASLLKSDWPVLPSFVTFILIVISCLSGWRHTWLADATGLLSVFVITQSTRSGIQKFDFSNNPSWRWPLLLIAAYLALSAGVGLQKLLWPPRQTPHPDWLLPVVAFGFVLFNLLPKEINQEASRRADLALADEQLKHRLERQILESRLAALQGQIEPHFLYNTLANTRALIRQDANSAEIMLNHLISYLRAAMPDLRANTTTLKQELKRAQAYLDIIKIRMGDRLQFSVTASAEAQRCLIPPLAVMTLVENAIKHGIEPQVGGGRLSISAFYESDQLVVEVTDDGAGFQSEMGDGIGLINLQERLLALFGAQAELSINDNRAVNPCTGNNIDSIKQKISATGVTARFTIPATTTRLS